MEDMGAGDHPPRHEVDSLPKGDGGEGGQAMLTSLCTLTSPSANRGPSLTSAARVIPISRSASK